MLSSVQIIRVYAGLQSATIGINDDYLGLSAQLIRAAFRQPRTPLRVVFQCIKYRAVMEAMDMRSQTQVIPLLVTQTPLPSDLADLVRRRGIRHFMAPGTLG